MLQKQNKIFDSNKHVVNLTKSIELHASEPLWKRVPTRDSDGKVYSDFMMLIPGLGDFESERRNSIIANIEKTLISYGADIILADLNLKLNVLWVTLKPNIGFAVEVASVLHHVVPEAKLVSQHRI